MLRRLPAFAIVFAAALSMHHAQCQEITGLKCNHALNGVIKIDFGIKRHPAYFSVTTPNGSHFLVRDIDFDIDFVGKSYSNNPIFLYPAKLMGVTKYNGKRITKLVFVRPGKYKLRFYDRVIMEHESPYELICMIDYEK